jgi:AmiR/NasT family two-component response regulator
MPSLDTRSSPLRVAVIADTPSAAAEIARALRDSGYAVRPFSLTAPSAYDRVRELRPAVVLLRTNSRNFSLASAFARTASRGEPALVLLTPSGSRQAIKLALDTGALVHLIEPVPAQALAAAVRVAAARAEDMRQLNAQLTQLRESVQARKVIERAKSVLMRRFGLTEEQAHRSLQRESRNRNRKLIDTAWHVIRADAHLSARRRPAPAVPR